MEVVITNENLETYKNGELPLVVDLWATWCGPVRLIGPIHLRTRRGVRR